MTPARSGLSLHSWDLLLLWGSLAGVVALSWWYIVGLAGEMSAMTNMAMVTVWDARQFIAMFVMWVVMMIGMMVPTAVRAIYIYTSVARAAKQRKNPIAAISWFVVGYVLAWTFFSAAATIMQASLDSIGLLSGNMATPSALLGGGLFIAAGFYQLTPWKDACLQHCQAPASFLAGRFSSRARDAVLLGAHHGAYCLGCCWLLMALLFVGGVMNLLWIAAITGFVLLEKLLPARLFFRHLAAAALLVAGVFILVLK